MDIELHVTLTQTFDKQPLATVDNLPGQGADLRPSQLRALAGALLAAADECETRPMGVRKFFKVKRSYSLLA